MEQLVPATGWPAAEEPDGPDGAQQVVTVVGIGADGWGGLSDPARQLVRAAEVVFGSARQLSLLPAAELAGGVGGHRQEWPSPLVPALPGLLATHAGRRLCVLASGDPLFFGVGRTLIRLLGAGRVRVVPHASALSLACARLGWPVEETDTVSTMGRPVQALHLAVQPGRRLLVLSAGPAIPAQVAALLVERGYGQSPLTVLEQLGAPAERGRTAAAAEVAAGAWDADPPDPLHVIAVCCRPGAGAPLLPAVPGLPDDAFRHDGQLTKREVRAITLARLAPVPGQLLWDVGAGAGSVAIEWMRTHRSCRAVAVETRPERAARIAENAAALGVPGLRIVTGAAPAALAGLEPPDAIFIGGGATAPGMVETCWQALAPGGRLVVNAVTVESEAALARWYGRLGGELNRISVQRAAPVGGFTGWRPAMPVTQWLVCRPADQSTGLAAAGPQAGSEVAGLPAGPEVADQQAGPAGLSLPAGPEVAGLPAGPEVTAGAPGVGEGEAG